jgi:hypothetical protein
MLAFDAGFTNADIASLTVAMVALILAVPALIVGIQQWHLAQEQTALTKKQAEIAEEQQRFVRAELAKRGILELRMKRDVTTETNCTTRVGIHNKGDKTIRGVYWSIYIPGQRGDYKIEFDGIKPNASTPVWVDDVLCAKYSGLTEEPIFPGRTLLFATLTILLETLRTNSLPIDWHLTSEDGPFPEEGKSGRFTFSINNPPSNSPDTDPQS